MSSFFECSLALIPLFTLHSSLFTLHFSLFTFHSSLFTFHSSLSTLPPYHNPYHFSPFTIKSLFDQSTFGAGEKLPHLFTLHSSLFTLHSSLFTLHSSLFTLHSSLFTLHSPLSTLITRTRGSCGSPQADTAPAPTPRLPPPARPSRTGAAGHPAGRRRT